MKKYLLTSDLFPGSVLFGYQPDGRLLLYHNESKMNDEQLGWLLNHLPQSEAEVKPFASRIRGRLEELPEDITFDNFWKKYGKKINRLRAEKLWNGMNDKQKAKAIAAVDPYKNFLIRTGFRAQADAERYLREAYYETNWNAEK